MNRAGSVAIQWIILCAASAAVIGALLAISFPAAWLIGAMVAGIAFTLSGGSLRISDTWSLIGQGVLGCLIAGAFPVDAPGGLLSQWPVFLISAVVLLLATAALGWALTAAKVLPGTTVVWGLSPGAATMMTFMSENAGADAQIVAFMQYLRVVLIAILVTVVAWVFDLGGATEPMLPPGPQAPLDWLGAGETLVLALSGPLVARVTGFKSAALVFPLGAGISLSYLGWLDIQLPSLLLIGVYALLGWRIGLRFTRPLVQHALSALPAVLGSSILLLGACGAIAAGMVVFAGIDPLTAFLATSPGGVDMIAVLAASSGADMGFVMTMQMVRFLLVLAIVPVVARAIDPRS